MTSGIFGRLCSRYGQINDKNQKYAAFFEGSVPDTGRYNDIKLKILRFSRKGVGCGEGKNLFSREKKDNGADVRPPPRDTIDPCREQRVFIDLI